MLILYSMLVLFWFCRLANDRYSTNDHSMDVCHAEIICGRLSLYLVVFVTKSDTQNCVDSECPLIVIWPTPKVCLLCVYL